MNNGRKPSASGSGKSGIAPIVNQGRSQPRSPSKALTGMQHWAKTIDTVVDSRAQAAKGHAPGHSETSNLAYTYYQKNAIHQQLNARNNTNHITMKPLGSLPKDRQMSHKEAGSIRTAQDPKSKFNIKLEEQDGRGAKNAFAYHALPKSDSNHVASLHRRNNNLVKEQGMSSRLTLTSDIFLSGSSHASKRNKEYANLTQATLQWASGAQSATGAKVMSAKSLNEGRVDHAILYGAVGSKSGVKQVADHLSGMLKKPSRYAPLGMEPLAPGVAYAEVARSQKTKTQYRSASRHYAHGKEPSSFGRSRADIVATAIQNKRNDANNGNLNSHLADSISSHGYSKSNPARLSSDYKRQREATAANAQMQKSKATGKRKK